MLLKKSLEKFKKLPKELRDEVSSVESVRVLEEIEKKYGLPLARVVILVMIKENKLDDLENFLQMELNVDSEKARIVKSELREKIFRRVLGYLDETQEHKNIETQEQRDREREEQKNRELLVIKPLLPITLDLEEDEKEIKKYATYNREHVTEEREELDKKVEKIIRESGKRIEDEEMEKRFKNIILAQLKEVRKSIETKEALMRPKKMGGMEMSEKEAGRIAEMIKDSRVIKDIRDVGDVRKDLRFKIQNLRGEKQIFPKPSISSTSPASSTSQASQTPPPSSTSQVHSTSSTSSEKSPKLTGPIEEIRELRLQDWKKLADIPKERAEKIKEKINLLEEESIERKASAIRAWKESEVNQLYLEIGRKSMEQGRSIADVIAERIQQGRSVLSLEEFEVIADLNQALRF